MSLRFLLGRAGSGKSHLCLEEIRRQLRELPIGPPLIYLVPEQISFQSEYTLAKTAESRGMIRAQVFSFRRLAWKVLQEVGGGARPHISSNGIKMLLRQAMEKHQEKLRLFSRSVDKTGFADQLEELYIELKRYNVNAEQLMKPYQRMLERAEQGPEFRLLTDKLHDLQLVFQEVAAKLDGHYLDSEDYLRLLAEKIPYSAYMREAEVWIDGFHGFTPQEYAVILSLLRTCRRVTISLCLDRPYDREQLERLDLFYPTGDTYLRIKEWAEKIGVEMESPVILGGEANGSYKLMRFKDAALHHLEQQIGRVAGESYHEETDSIQLFQAVNRRAEVEGIAREIVDLVRDHGYRYRDIAVMVRDGETYQDLISTVFPDYGIPIFLDAKRSMLHHPLIELIRSALEVIEHGWPSDALFRCLKTDLLLPDQGLRNDLDRLENLVLAYGITGSRWTDGKPWEMEEEDRFAQLRQRIVAPLADLEKRLQQAQDIRAMVTALYLFLEGLEIPKRLEEWMEEAQQAGDLLKVREHGQVWSSVVDLCDQMVEVMGEDHLPLPSFIKIFTAGLEGMQFSLVPPGLDQVVVGTMDRTRASNLKAIFLLGVNDGILPARPKEDGILLESERDLLLQEGIELAPGSRQRLLEEEFLIYTLFASPRERLYLSYPLADEEGRALAPSEVVKRLKQIFPHLKERLILLEPAVGEDLFFVNHPRRTLSYLSVKLRGWQKGYPIDPLWFDLYNWFIRHPIWSDLAKHLLSALFYRNQESRLRQETSRSLYGTHLKASVSRLELYQSCPFSHFASYGLKLQERQVFRLDTPDIGQLFHGALHRMTELIQAEGRTWADLEEAEVERLSDQVVDQVTPELKRQILVSSNRMQYIGYKLKNVVKRAGHVLHQHALRSQFTTIGSEILFPQEGELPTLRFTLRNGCTLELVGRIDRVDQARGQEGLYVRVIDYKSGSRSLDLSEVFFGLSLQMLAYLDVVVTHAENWLGERAVPAGMLYFHVHNPMLSAEGPMSHEEIGRKLLSKHKMRGLILENQEAVELMDIHTKSYEQLSNGYSSLIPVRVKREGGFVHHQSSLVNLRQLEQLRQHVRKLIQEIGTEITDGVVEISPYQFKKKMPCSFCVYKPVCQFDPLFEDNRYRRLMAKKKDEIWTELGLGGGKEE